MDNGHSDYIDFSRPKPGKIRSIDEVLTYGYNYDIGTIISTAWSKVSGFKLYSFIYLFIIGTVNSLLPQVLQVLVSILIQPILVCGLYFAASQHYHNKIFSFSDLFRFFPLAGTIVLYALVSGLITMVGFILLIIPGIYFIICYQLTPLIIINNPQISFWTAMEISRKVISMHWWKNFGLFLLLGVILCVSFILLFIPLIWTLPLASLVLVVLYDTIFGLAGQEESVQNYIS